MPLQTFFNLPEEKRKQILEIAIDEFAENDYDSASISRIVARAGIAKGSFYQYFTDKQDLYSYLFHLIYQAKTEFMSLDHPDPQHIGVFAYMRWTAEVGVAFQLAYPDLSRLALRLMNSSPFPRELDAQTQHAAATFYRKLVEVGQQQGDIDPGLDPTVAAIVFESAINGISRHIWERIRSGEIAMPKGDNAVFDMEQVKGVFNQLVSILEDGMRPKPGACKARGAGEASLVGSLLETGVE